MLAKILYKEILSDIAILFYNSYGGEYIGGMWRSSYKDGIKWTLSQTYPTIPSDDASEGLSKSRARLFPHIEAIFALIEEVGNGLVLQVKTQ